MISNIKLFILTFSLGSLIIFFSFIFYYGPKEYFLTIRKKQFIIVYIIIISILIGFYIKFNWKIILKRIINKKERKISY